MKAGPGRDQPYPKYIPRILYQNGYETAFMGKWHMGFDDTRRPGFDRWVSFHAQGLYVNPVVNVGMASGGNCAAI